MKDGSHNNISLNNQLLIAKKICLLTASLLRYFYAEVVHHCMIDSVQ